MNMSEYLFDWPLSSTYEGRFGQTVVNAAAPDGFSSIRNGRVGKSPPGGSAMAAMSELRGRLRALWTQAEVVAMARGAGNQRALDTAITVRNDMIAGVELAFSALRSENKRLKATIAKMDKEAGNE